MKTVKAKRPMRAILALSVVVVLGVGLAAYFVNVPILWIAIAEVVALFALGFRATKLKQSQPLAEGVQDQATNE